MKGTNLVGRLIGRAWIHHNELVGSCGRRPAEASTKSIMTEKLGCLTGHQACI